MKPGHLLLLGLGAAALFTRRTTSFQFTPKWAPALAAVGASEGEVAAVLAAENPKTAEAREKLIRAVLGGKVKALLLFLAQKGIKAAGVALNAFEFAVIHALNPKLAASLAGDRMIYDRLVMEVGASSPLVSIANERNLSKVIRNAVLSLSPENQKKFAASCASNVLEIWKNAVPGDALAEKLVRAIQRNADGELSDAALTDIGRDFESKLSRLKNNPVGLAAGQALKMAAINAHSIAANQGRVAASITELSRLVAKAETELARAKVAARQPEVVLPRGRETAAQRAFRESAEQAGETLAQREARAVTRSGTEAAEETLDAVLKRILRNIE